MDLSRNRPQEIILLILATFSLDYNNYLDIVWRKYSLGTSKVKQITGASTISIYLTTTPRVQMGSESIAHEAEG